MTEHAAHEADFPPVADTRIEIEFDDVDPGDPEDDSVFADRPCNDERALVMAWEPQQPFPDQKRPDPADHEAGRGGSDA